MEKKTLYLKVIQKMQAELARNNEIHPETEREFTILMNALRNLKIDLEDEK
jgi:hypothetical protein